MQVEIIYINDEYLIVKDGIKSVPFKIDISKYIVPKNPVLHSKINLIRRKKV